MGSTIAQYAGVVLLVAAATAGVLGYFRANVSKSTIELYKEDNAALRARLETLEEQTKADRIEIASLKASLLHLVGIVTQAKEIAAMRTVLDRIAAKIGA